MRILRILCAAVAFCMFSAPFGKAQTVLEFAEELTTNQDSFYYPADTVIVQSFRIVNTGPDPYTGPILFYTRVYPAYNGNTTDWFLDGINVTSFNTGDTVTVTVDETFSPNGIKYDGGGNIIVIWPVVQDNPNVQTPDTTDHEIWIDPLLNIPTPCDEMDSDVRVFPNPSKGLFRLDTETHCGSIGLESVRVMGLNGQVLMQLQGDLREIDLRSQPEGIYLIEVIDENGRRSVHKVLKQD